MSIEVESAGEFVIVDVDDEGGIAKLNTRDAFDLVTDLLTAIDQARGYGAAMRREVPDPRLKGGARNYATNRKIRRPRA